nr:tyrosine-type recombinase/integrase [Pirellulales bacterium]
AKPRPDFPLFPHRNGRWAKKVRGKFVYFGKWEDDPKGDAAVNQWLEQKDDLLAGRAPRTNDDGLTVVALVNRFLTAKESLVETGELQRRTWQDYYAVCARVVRVFGRNRLASDLAPEDFARLRADSAKTRGPVALTNDIARVRVLLKWGYDEGLLAAPMRYGQSFDRPSRKTIRLSRATNGPRMFEREQVLAMLNGATVKENRVAGATPPLRTMILLAVNAGLGNSDVGKMPLSSLDFKGGWLNFPRPKTGIERRVPLWPETIASLRDWLKQRPDPISKAAEELVFVTSAGGSWSKSEADNPVCKETAKLLKRLELHSAGLNFYSLRRTFRTIASEARDEAAADALMGHAPRSNDMAAVYRQRINDDRLRAVVDYVRVWLFNEGRAGQA